MKKQKLYLIGAGGLARQIDSSPEADIVQCYITMDNEAIEPMQDRTTKIKNWEELDKTKEYIVAIADNKAREQVVNELKTSGIKIGSFVVRSPLNFAEFGEGCICLSYNQFSKGVQISKYSIICEDVGLGHDTIIHEYNFIAPSTKIGAEVSIGKYTFLGMSITILPKITIGEECIISAKTLVRKNIPNHGKLLGDKLITKRTSTSSTKNL